MLLKKLGRQYMGRSGVQQRVNRDIFKTEGIRNISIGDFTVELDDPVRIFKF
jgi:hypothetical protein